MKIVEQNATLEWNTPEPEAAINRAARTCYKSQGETSLIPMLIERGHESVLEHALASIRIICDRGVSHEIVRHRLASYSQESTRYCNYTSERFGAEITVIEPSIGDAMQRANWRAAVRHAEATYQSMIENKIAPQIARSVLPTCLKTELVMTCNFREWRHFLKLRLAPAAHPQMRLLARQVFMILHALSSACFPQQEFENAKEAAK